MPRGRPRKQGLPRDPDGNIARRYYDFANAKEARSVVVAARVRQFGLTEAQASDTVEHGVNASSVIGRMRLKGIEEEMSERAPAEGAVTADQWQAACWYIRTRNAFLRSILAKGEASTTEGPGHGSENSDGYVDWCQKQAEMWNEVQDCLRDASVENRSPIPAAFDVFLVRDVHLAHLEGTLKLGLNAIYRRFLRGSR